MVTPTGRGLDRKGRASAGSSSRQQGSQKAQLEFSTRRETWREGRARDRERNPGTLTGSRPSPAMGGISKWGRGLQKSGIQATGEKGHPASPGARRGFPLEPLCLQAAWLQPPAGDTIRAGGVGPRKRASRRGRWEWWSDRQMVGLPRGPAAAVARPSAHARPLPPGRAPPASGGRGFPVVRPRRRGGTRAYPSLLVLIGPSSCARQVDWLRGCQSVPSRTYIFLPLQSGLGEVRGARGWRGCPRGWRRGCCCGLISGILGRGLLPPCGTPTPQWERCRPTPLCLQVRNSSKVCSPPAALCRETPARAG